MNISRFDPSPYGFPRPRISPLPHRLEFDLVRWFSRPCNQGAFRSFTRGRYALRAAYRLSGLEHKTTLLAPAYHCLTMLDPAVDLGADITLYPLNPDLSPDLDQLDKAAAKAASPIKALLATHFFGWIRNFEKLKQWCDERNVVLIEDCSHVLFTEHHHSPGAGAFGKYVVSSPYKFIACEDGGLLYAPDGNLPQETRTQPQSLVDELRGIKRALEKNRQATAPTIPPNLDSGLRRNDEEPPSSRRKPGPSVCPGSLDSGLRRNDEEPPSSRRRPGPSVCARSVDSSFFQPTSHALLPQKTEDLDLIPYDHPSPLFSPEEANKSALCTSRWLARCASADSISKQRRNNYSHWLDAVSKLPNCHPLYPDLPDNCTPYMFPLVIEHPDPHFFWLKQSGVPIWRWDEMAVSDCPVSRRYQLHLLHLPCHQSVSEEQMAWMTATLKNVVHNPVSGDR